MFATLDQWAFQFFVLIASVISVPSIPIEKNQDWQIKEQWSLQKDQSYKLVVSSNSISELCRKEPDQFVIFPQAYMGRQMVYLDNKLVTSNVIRETWKISSIFSEIIVPCEILAQGSEVVYQIDSYHYFFAHLESYPVISKGVPRVAYLNNSMNLIAISICFCLAVFGSIIMFSLGSREQILSYFIQNILLALLMFGYAPGFIGYADFAITHSIVELSLWGSFLFLIKPFFFQKREMLFYFILSLLALYCILFFSYRNLIQLVSSIMILPAIATIGIINFRIFRKNSGFRFTEKTLFILVLGLAIKDGYISHVTQSGYFHLSALVILISAITFNRILKQIEIKAIEMEFARNSLATERKIVDKVSLISSMQKEIIHDLKSPLTSLNFLFASGTVNIENARVLSGRIVEILDRIENESVIKSADWFSLVLLKKCIEDVVRDRRMSSVLEFNFDAGENLPNSIFFDPVEMKIVFDEIINNAVKHAGPVTKISCALSVIEDYIVIKILSYEVVDSFAGKNEIGEKGISSTGSGYGLFGIKNKVKSVGGEFEYLFTDEGFQSTIKLKIREV